MLTDEQGTVGHVGTRRLDRPPPWLEVWRHRAEIDSPLAYWLRTLDRQPTEKILLGSVGIHGPTARAVVALLAEWYGQPGGPPTSADAATPPAESSRGRGPGAGRRVPPPRHNLGVSRWEVLHKLRSGKLLNLD